ncbi:hypothetical protein KVT40_009149 [Elsinoe batatas]|uniref:5-Methylcytosine G/T mismatch-specific DNA glycosylase n=1 Tax=Elsinoe batatas TaxID=2601811 RepID=A0A8K0L1M6_9PEZI|nr:hypothetical protein KVT40_009149 [Elsinoe batatas]
MPSKDGDTPRRKSKWGEDSPRSKDKDREKERHKPSKKHHRRSSSPERTKPKSRPHSPDSSKLSRASMIDLSSRQSKPTMSSVPEMSRRASLGDSKISSYPAFSKEHSREAVRPSQEPAKSKISILTPDPTEGGKSDRSKHSRKKGSESKSRAPPSPPLTADEGDLKRANSANSSRRSNDSVRHESRRSVDLGARLRTSQLRTETSTSPRKASRGEDSDSSAKTTESSRGTSRRYASGASLHRDAVDRERSASHRTPTQGSLQGSQVATDTDSQATSVAPERKTPAPATVPANAASSFPTSADSQHASPAAQASMPRPASIPLRPLSQTPGSIPEVPPSWPQPGGIGTVQPPPPPPPMDVPQETPRVDYLLLNGGLPYLLPKSLIPGSNQPPVQPYQQYMSPRIPPSNASSDAAQIFSPVMKRIEDLNKVLTKNGSVAVATGYRSVARRLLDRLEHVFARNISSEKCECVMCNTQPASTLSAEEADGVSWGEILEFVSGRRELPPWPPFTLDPETNGLGISGKIETPMQKLDPDVPEEYKQHYLRQNDKTKRSVQSWLEAQNVNAPQSEPPTDVDDETLSFAMITRLEPDKRPLFAALMKGQSTLPSANPSRAATPANNASPERPNTVLSLASSALQRLYRLQSRPRNPEATLYLLNNPHLHSMLATLAAIAPQEWDILVSGRFDGFLWSGAETSFPPSASIAGSRPPTRGPTPFSPTSRGPTPFSRGATPFSAAGSTAPSTSGQPVQHDEETEIAVLFEVERAIYRDMEMLEDAFEALHQGAETLRANLRSRAAGLSVAAQARRGSSASEAGELGAGRWGATPGSLGGWGTEEEVFDDGRSELAPDDSASNISFARRRRGKERRTPGLEEREEGGTAAERRRRR